MTRRLLLGYLGLTVLVLAVLEIPLAVTQARTARADLTFRVERDAVALASLAQGVVQERAREPLGRVRRIAGDYAARTGGRAVVVDRRGRSLVDTSGEFGPGREFASRPEIRAALSGEVASGIRASETLGTRLLYVAVPVASAGSVDGAVRITYPTSELDERVRRYRLTLLAIAGLVLFGATAIGVVLARSITRPLRAVETAAAELGRGDLRARVRAAGPPEVRQLAHSFNDTAAKLEALVHSQEQFVADASHELRTPLTALRLRLENLEREISPDGRGDLEAATDELERLNEMVENLLALARADASEAPAEEVPLNELLEDRARAWEAYAAERGVALVTELDGRPAARAGRGRLEQVVDNLLANAIEVSPAGGRIWIRAGSARGSVVLQVVDEGPGLTRIERERAFDRFWRGRTGGGGSGLGLSITRRLVELDGGTVELREAPSGGVEAVATLPSGR